MTLAHLPYDVSRCVNGDCERRLSCARFTTPYRDDVLYVMSHFDAKDCEYFIDNKEHEKDE